MQRIRYSRNTGSAAEKWILREELTLFVDVKQESVGSSQAVFGDVGPNIQQIFVSLRSSQKARHHNPC